MKITVKLFSAPIQLDVEENETIIDIKNKIKLAKNIDTDIQRLVFLREPLDDDSKTLKDCKIENGATLYLMLRLFVNKEPNMSLPVKLKKQNQAKRI
jgi:hypothetical protein